MYQLLYNSTKSQHRQNSITPEMLSISHAILHISSLPCWLSHLAIALKCLFGSFCVFWRSKNFYVYDFLFPL